MRRMLIVLGLVLVVACGGGSDESDSDDTDAGGGAVTADLPDDFDDALVPPGTISSAYTVLGATATATFEVEGSFEDTVAHYTDALGEPDFNSSDAGGDDDSRLVQWNRPDGWSVTILDTDPTSIGVTRIEG